MEEKIRVLQHQKTQLVTNVLGDEGFASSLGMDDLAFILGTGGDADFGSEDDEPEPKGPKAKKGSIIDAEVVSDADKADAAAKKATKKTAKKAAKKTAKKAAKKAARKK